MRKRLSPMIVISVIALFLTLTGGAHTVPRSLQEESHARTPSGGAGAGNRDRES
jgi:hypothetical protein